MSNKSTTQKQSSALVQNIVNCALEKKAEKLLVLDVYNLTTLADYFIICSANTEPQIKAICDKLDQYLLPILTESLYTLAAYFPR